MRIGSWYRIVLAVVIAVGLLATRGDAACCRCIVADTAGGCPTGAAQCFTVTATDCNAAIATNCEPLGCTFADFYAADCPALGEGCSVIDGVPLPTPTPTPAPQGNACRETANCLPGLFCADGVCCDTACTGSGQNCAVPGQEGTCVQGPADAPTASRATLAAMLGALVLTALLALRVRQVG